MNRMMDWFNLAGVAALAILCALQWRTNAGLAVSVRDLEQTGQTQAATIADGAAKLKTTTADLDDAYARLSLAESQSADLQKKLDASVIERDQFKTSLTQWQAAVVARDAALKADNATIEKLATERNTAINKFNALAGDYNKLAAHNNDKR